MLLCVLLCVSVLLINYNPTWFYRELPRENFGMLTLTKMIPTQCLDDSCEELINYQIILESSASGVVFKRINDVSYVLTAEHFCNAETSLEDAFGDLVISKIQLTDIHGNLWDTEVLLYNKHDDLCLMKTEMPIEKNVYFANRMPALGEKVFAISAPMGLYAKNVSLHFEGLFSGCDDNNMCFFTIPAVGGSSGSLVYNKEGRVVSMIQMAVMNFHSLSMGVKIDKIQSFLKDASATLELDLL